MIDPEGMIKDLRNLVKAQEDLINTLYKRLEWREQHDLIVRDLDGDRVVELNLSKYKGEKLGDIFDKLKVEELLEADTDGDKMFAPAPAESRKLFQTEKSEMSFFERVLRDYADYLKAHIVATTQATTENMHLWIDRTVNGFLGKSKDEAEESFFLKDLCGCVKEYSCKKCEKYDTCKSYRQ